MVASASTRGSLGAYAPARRPTDRLGQARTSVTKILGPLVVLLILIAVPFVVDAVTVSRVQQILIYSLVAMGMNLGFGFAGQLSLAQPVIMGVAAYAAAIASVHAHWSAWQTLPLSLAAAVVTGVLLSLPAYRIKGWYMAITSVFAITVFPGLVSLQDNYTGGTNGLPGVGPLPGVQFLAGSSARGYEIVLGCVAFTWLVIRNIATSSWGIILRSIRDAPRAAEASGVNIRLTALSASIFAAIPVGLAGWLWAHTTFFVSADDFSFNLVLLIAAAVFLGGRGTLWGPIIGTALFETLSLFIGPFSATNQLVLGLGLLTLAVLAPKGIVAYWRMGEEYVRPRLRSWLPARIAGALGPPVEVQTRTASTLPRPQIRTAVESAAAELDAVAKPDETRANHAGGAVCEFVGVEKSFGGLAVLTDVNLELTATEVVGIVGPNGSGKTTMLNIMTGFIRPDAGELLVSGRRVGAVPPHIVARGGLRRSFQVPQLIGELSAEENIWLGILGPDGQRIFGSLVRSPRYRRRARDGWARVAEVCDYLALDAAVRTQPVSSLPLGLRRVVEIGRCIADPSFVAVCLDEPASGLAPEEVVRLGEVIRLVAAQGAAVAVIEHNLRFVRETCDRVVQMTDGRLVGITEIRGVRETGSLEPRVRERLSDSAL